MTAPAFEFEDAVEVEAGAVGPAVCVACGAGTNAVPQKAAEARCAPCLRLSTDAAVQAHLDDPERLCVHPERVEGYTVPTGYPLGQAPAVVVQALEHPEPEFVGQWWWADYEWLELGADMREAGLPGIPDSVSALEALARSQGWKVRLRYTRGHGKHSVTGKPTALQHSLAVAFAGHAGTQRQAVAVYSRPVNGGTWTWGTVYLWGPDLPPFGHAGVTELKEFLADPAKPMLWFRAIAKKRKEQAAATKERNKAKTKASTKESGG